MRSAAILLLLFVLHVRAEMTTPRLLRYTGTPAASDCFSGRIGWLAVNTATSPDTVSICKETSGTASWVATGNSPNTVVQLGAVAQASNVSVTTTETPLFSLTLPRLPAATCAYLWYQASNLTASANVTYKFYLGSGSQTLITSSSGLISHDVMICNQAGVQNAQNVIYTFRNGTMANPVNMAVDTSVSQTVQITGTSAAAIQLVRVYGAKLEAPQ